MRRLPFCLGLIGLCLLAGCDKFAFLRPKSDAPRVAGPLPSADEVTASLNRNAQAIQSIECTQVDLDCSHGIQSIGLDAKLVCQKPQNFRMNAKIGGSTMVDMGSNEQEFWFWISKADPPYLYHCAYQDYNTGRARLPFPFQPQWVMEALGMGAYEARNCTVAANRSTGFDLIEQAQGPDGKPVRKVTVVRRVQDQYQAIAHHLADARGKEICSAYVMAFQQDHITGAILPKQVQLMWPAERMKMKITLQGTTVNDQIPAGRVAALFTRPSWQNIQGYDLARGPDSPAGQVQRTNARGFGH